jgi:hypothetical protein
MRCCCCCCCAAGGGAGARGGRRDEGQGGAKGRGRRGAAGAEGRAVLLRAARGLGGLARRARPGAAEGRRGGHRHRATVASGRRRAHLCSAAGPGRGRRLQRRGLLLHRAPCCRARLAPPALPLLAHVHHNDSYVVWAAFRLGHAQQRVGRHPEGQQAAAGQQRRGEGAGEQAAAASGRAGQGRGCAEAVAARLLGCRPAGGSPSSAAELRRGSQGGAPAGGAPAEALAAAALQAPGHQRACLGALHHVPQPVAGQQQELVLRAAAAGQERGGRRWASGRTGSTAPCCRAAQRISTQPAAHAHAHGRRARALPPLGRPPRHGRRQPPASPPLRAHLKQASSGSGMTP